MNGLPFSLGCRKPISGKPNDTYIGSKPYDAVDWSIGRVNATAMVAFALARDAKSDGPDEVYDNSVSVI